MKHLKTYKIFEALSDADIKDIQEVLDDLYYEDIGIECEVYDDKNASRNEIRVVFNHLGNNAVNYDDLKKPIYFDMYQKLYEMLEPKLELLKDYGIEPNSVCYFFERWADEFGVPNFRPMRASAILLKPIYREWKNLGSIWITFSVNRAR